MILLIYLPTQNFNLIVEQQADATEASDISYVTSGYAPLSVRLVQLALEPGGWASKLDSLKLLPGATICDVRQPGVNTPSNSRARTGPPSPSDPAVESHAGNGEASTTTAAAATSENGRKVMVVFFVGGVTHLEIAALRFLQRQESCAYSIIIATTKIINGNSMLKSLMHHVEVKTRR
jgi:hypothetical protein